MNILLLGGHGMLGSDVRSHLAKRGLTCTAPTVQELDITSPEAVAKWMATGWDFVINCAAYTAVDKAETERDDANLVNGLAPGYLARACVVYGSKLLHVSTDFVFDGTKSEPYLESDRPNPLGVYACSKRTGEEAVISSGAKSWVVRTSWLYGPHGNSFPRTMIQAAKAGKTLRVVADQTGTPTYTADLARVLIEIMLNEPAPGVYHAAGPDVMTWHEFAVMALDVARVDIPIEAISTLDWPTPAPRPRYSALSFSKCLACGIEPMRATRVALAEFADRLSAS